MREPLELETINDPQKSLVGPQKIFLSGFHIKLGIVENFIRKLNKNGEAGLFFLKNKFPKPSEGKIREVVCNGPQIRQLMLDCNIEKSLTELER